VRSWRTLDIQRHA